MPRFFRRTALCFVALLIATAASTVSVALLDAAPASASPSVSVTWNVDARTHLAKLGSDVTVPRGSFSGSIDLSNGQLVGNLALPARADHDRARGGGPRGRRELRHRPGRADHRSRRLLRLPRPDVVDLRHPAGEGHAARAGFPGPGRGPARRRCQPRRARLPHVDADHGRHGRHRRLRARWHVQRDVHDPEVPALRGHDRGDQRDYPRRRQHVRGHLLAPGHPCTPRPARPGPGAVRPPACRHRAPPPVAGATAPAQATLGLSALLPVDSPPGACRPR